MGCGHSSNSTNVRGSYIKKPINNGLNGDSPLTKPGDNKEFGLKEEKSNSNGLNDNGNKESIINEQINLNENSGKDVEIKEESQIFSDIIFDENGINEIQNNFKNKEK